MMAACSLGESAKTEATFAGKHRDGCTRFPGEGRLLRLCRVAIQGGFQHEGSTKAKDASDLH